MSNIFSANLPVEEFCKKKIVLNGSGTGRKWLMGHNTYWVYIWLISRQWLTVSNQYFNQYFFHENQLYKRRGVLCTVLNHKMSSTAVEFETGFLKIHDFQAYVNATSIFLDIFFVVCCLELNLLASAKR